MHGPFIRITSAAKSGGRFDVVIIPQDRMVEFEDAFTDTMTKAEDEGFVEKTD